MQPTLQYIDIPIFNQLVPKEGPKAISVALDFTATSSYELDLQNLQSRTVISAIQTVFVDNSNCTEATIINVNNTYQTLKIPPGAQGYFPLLAPNPPRFAFSGSGGICHIQLINVPMPLATWGVGKQSMAFDSSGNLLVSDTAVQSMLSTTLQTQQWAYRGVTPRPIYMQSSNYYGQISSAGNVTIESDNWCLKLLHLYITPDFQGDGSDDIVITLDRDLSGEAHNLQFNLGKMSTAPGGGGMVVCSLDNLNYMPSTLDDNQSLVLRVTGPITAGHINYNVGVSTGIQL